MAINLDEKALLGQYGQAKQTEIERLLAQYSTSLSDIREMYPQLTTAIEQRRLMTSFPSEPVFFTPSEAMDMGLSLQEGWMLKISPTEGGLTSSLITPEKWEITEDNYYISPSGERISQADLQAQLSPPTGGFAPPEIVIPTVEDLTEEGRTQYQEYQAAGGQLDVAGWYREREQEQLETEQVFGKVFPEQDIDEIYEYIQADTQGFLADMREIGWTADSEALIRHLYPEVTAEDLRAIFGQVAPYIPESWVKDAKDAFIAGAVSGLQNIETFLFTQPVSKPIPGLLEAVSTHTTALAPELMQTPELYQQYIEPMVQARYEEALRNTADAYLRRKEQQQEYWIDHPELVPNPEYLKSPWQNPSLFLNPGYIAYSVSSSLAYTLAVMGTIVGLSALATPVVGIPAGMLVATLPEAGAMLDQLISMGVPLEEARGKALLGGLIAGGVETVSDLPFIGLVFKPLKPAVQPLIKTIQRVTTNAIAKAVITGLTIPQIEGLEEVITQVGQNAILREYDNTKSILEGVSQAYIQAVIATLPFALIGGGASYRTFRNNLSPDAGTRLDTLVTELEQKGLTEEQAQVQAVNELAKDPEMEPDLSKAIEAAQTEYLESQGVKSVEELIPDTGFAGKILNEIKIAEEIKVTPVTPEIITGQPYTATVFRGYKPGTAPTDEGLFGKGTYYTTNKEYAETYDGKEVMEVTLNNPFVINSQAEAEAFWNEHTRPVRQQALEEGKTVQEADEAAAVAAREWLESQGYDGLIARNIIEKGDEVVVFERKKAVGPTMPAAEVTTPAGMPELSSEITRAIENTPGAEITPNGIKLTVVRYQLPEQAGQPSLRGGVFYLPEAKSRYQRYYTTGKIGYGGRQRIEGTVVIQNPIWAKGASGGRVPQLVYDQIKGKGAYEGMRSDVIQNALPKYWEKEEPGGHIRRVEELLKKYGGHSDLADAIVEYSTKGNQLAYAIQENIVAATVEQAGYDAILGYSVIKGEYRLSELMLVTSRNYPDLETFIGKTDEPQKETVTPTAIPTTEVGMPEAGLQAGIPGMAAAEPVRPTGKLVQARIDDYLRLREYNKQAVTDRIAAIKKALEKKGRSELGLKGTLKLELARLEAQQELDAVENLHDLDVLIRDVEGELGLRSLPGRGQPARKGIAKARHPGVPNLFPEYTSKQLDEMRNVYLQAREKMQPSTPVVMAKDVPMDTPSLQNMTLTPAQVEKTIDLFKQAIIAPNAELQRAASIELRKHVLAQRAKSAHESAEAMIVEGANPEDAIKMAEQMFMTGKLPDLTTDYFNDLTQEMRNVLFAKVYNYWNAKPDGWFELISTFDALTNALSGRSIPRIKGIGTKYFPNGGSAWDRLVRVFVGDIEVLNALDQGKALGDVIQGVLLESGRGSITLGQETVDWLKSLSTISEEDRLRLSKPLSELTEEDVKRIATRWFWNRQNELNTLLTAGTITREEYQLELAIAKDRVFPHKPMRPGVTYPSGVVGQPRLGEGYKPTQPIPETRTAEQLRLARWELEKRLRAATIESIPTPPPAGWSIDNELAKQLPLLTLKEREMLVRTLKNAGLTVVDIGNLIRANKASFDFSFWRQAKLLAAGHPIKFYHANIEAWKALWSQANAEASWTRITRHPFYQLYLDAVAKGGTDFLRPLELPKGTAQYKGVEEFGFLTEERLIPRITGRIPWVKVSSRSFVTGTNAISWSVFVDLIKTAQRYAEKIASGEIKLKEGEGFSLMDDVVAYTKELGDFGQRASLGKAAPLAPELGGLFFAVRSKLGRLLAPRHLLSSNPRVRAEAWRDFTGFIGTMGGLVMMGYFLGLWDVEDDPRNAEFMSIRIGNMRIDPWAGYRQFLVLYTRLITGTGVSSVTGQEYEVNPVAALTSFFRSSLSPLASILLDFWTGKDFLGDKIDVTDPKKWVERIAPFAIQDIYEAWQDSWQHGVIAILPAIVGEGVQTYTGDWAENWNKIGLPKYPENTGYGIYEPLYDLGDFWADTASQFRGVDPATLTASKGFPEYVRSIAQALQIIDQIELLPNKKLTSLNADPEKGTTFMQYYQMWQDRERIVASGDEEALKAFDADERTKNAYYGNITQSQYALLVEYHSLPDSQKAEFLGKHPELYVNPREDWLRTHPQENALLALWGKADVYSAEALSRVSRLAHSLGIPENALVMEDLSQVAELKLKNQKLFDLLEAYGGLDDTLKGPDGLTARDRAIQQVYLDNPDFRDDERRIEALNVGTQDNPTSEQMIEGWVERGQIADDFGSSSAEMKLWLIDNKEVHQWALDNALLSDTGEDWNENILRLQVNYREDFDKYEALTSPEAREAMLFDNKGMTSFGVAYYTINALQKDIPENLVPTYVEYYGIRKKEGVDYSAGWYEDDWYLIEHSDFYQTMISLGEWQTRDFTKVPTREVYSLYKTYMTLATGNPRLDFRAQHLDLDAWLVLAKGYTPIGNR